VSPLGWLGFLGAAGLGATTRYLLSLLVQERVAANRPWGTFVVNVAGCLAAGVVAGLVIHHGLGEEVTRVMAVGFLGSFTTFSTLTYETVRLAEEGELRVAAANVIGSLVIGIAAAGLGLAGAGAWG
jgi:fluoride exporter